MRRLLGRWALLVGTLLATSVHAAPGQQDLLAALKQDRDDYRQLPNDLQRSAFLRSAQFKTCETLKSAEIVGWIGEIVNLKEMRKGRAALAVRMEGAYALGIVFATALDEKDEDATRTLIAPGTPLFEAVSKLRERQRVLVGAKLVDDTGADCKAQVRARLEKPDGKLPLLTVMFSSVRPAD